MNKKKNRKISLSIIIVICIALLSFVVSMQSPLNIWCGNGNTNHDSSAFKTVAFYMSKGFMPYRDTFDHKGPIVYIYNWLGMQIAYWRGIWCIELLTLFITFLIIYRVARLVCGRVSSLLTLLLVGSSLLDYFEGGNLTEEYALPFIAISLYIFTDYFLNKTINCLRLIVCGFSFGAVCLLRVNMISLWIAFCLAVLIQCVRYKTYKRIGEFLLFFLAGMGLIVVPVFLWLIWNGAFGAFINDYWIFNHMYITDGVRASMGNKYDSFSHFMNDTLVLISGISTVILCFKRKDLFHTGYVGYFLLTFLFICLSGKKYMHYGMILVPLMSYPIAGLFSVMDMKSGASILMAAYILAELALPRWIHGLDIVAAYYSERNQNERTDQIGQIVEVIRQNTTEDDRITVWGGSDIFYVLSRRLSASKYSYQFPIGEVNTNILDEYFDELEENNPELIIACRELGKMEMFIRKHKYRLSGEFDDIQVYKK